MSSITVLLPVYNGASYLAEAVQSILEQSFKDFTLLVIDDASTDATLAVMKGFNDPRIVLVRNEKNLGLIATLNKGIDLCKTELLARMDQDDVADHERLKIQMEYLLRHPAAALVASPILGITPEGRERDQWQLDFETRTALAIRKQMPLSNCISHPTVLIRTAVIKKYRYHARQIGSEDWDLWLRLLRDGHELIKTNEILLRYRIHPASVTSRYRKKQHTQIKSAYVKWRFFTQSLRELKVNRFVLRSLSSIPRDLFYYFRTTFLPQVARQIKWLFTINPFQAWLQSAQLRQSLKEGISRHFFFFPYSHLGGAEKVHAAITKANSHRKPFVFITGLNDQQPWLEQFGEEQKIIRMAAGLYHPFFAKKNRHRILTKIHQEEKAVVLGANNRFFDELIPLLNEQVRVVDLTHDYDYEKNDEEAEATLGAWLRCDKRIFISSNTLERCRSFYKKNFADPSDEKRLQLILNGVAPLAQEPVKNYSDCLQILYTGRDTPEKRVDVIFQLASRCQELALPLQFILAGPIEMRSAFQHLENIKLTGSITDTAILQRLYAEAHLCIISSVSEGFPMSLMEGMMARCTPLSTSVGDISTHIRNGINGFLTTKTTEKEIVEDFCSILKILLADRSLLQKTALSAEEYAKTNFGYAAFEKNWRELLD